MASEAPMGRSGGGRHTPLLHLWFNTDEPLHTAHLSEVLYVHSTKKIESRDPSLRG